MTRGAIRSWYLVHKWTSLICTAFMLLLCVTGLPLIFAHEIHHAFSKHHPGEGQSLPLETLLASGVKANPGVGLFFSFDDEDPLVYVTTGPTPDAKPEDMEFATIDRLTGEVVDPASSDGLMEVIFRLHVDLFAGLPGMLFLGFMGLLLFVSIVSGVVVYAPFMRKLDFGTLRVRRSTRLKWLDYHNLLGVVTVAWLSVVGLTGVINTLSTPITQMWQAGELAEMTAGYENKPPPERMVSMDHVVATAEAAAPGMTVQFVAFPGGDFSSKHHFAVFMHGSTPLTEKLLTPALIDAETGELTTIRSMPWYFQALLLSQPLHFGDYGGLGLKIVWALLDIVTIVVLGSGLYLWLGRRRAPIEARLAEVEQGGVPAGAAS